MHLIYMRFLEKGEKHKILINSTMKLLLASASMTQLQLIVSVLCKQCALSSRHVKFNNIPQKQCIISEGI